MLQNSNEIANKVPNRNVGLAQILKTIAFRCFVKRLGKALWPK